MAAAIVVDGKCSYPAACNATEAVLWDRSATRGLDAVVSALENHNVEIRGCPVTRTRHPHLVAATDRDWGTEFGEPIIAIRAVAGLDEAFEHIARHGSKHTESIVTGDRDAAEAFLTAVDAASVFHNASTRFADGYRYGLGAEVGISTGKLHARGPVGVEGLLTYRWVLRGTGQCSADYGPGKRSFRHADLDLTEVDSSG
jgi:glutamate-5-semialdehyde dehydrogenase